VCVVKFAKGFIHKRRGRLPDRLYAHRSTHTCMLAGKRKGMWRSSECALRLPGWLLAACLGFALPVQEPLGAAAAEDQSATPVPHAAAPASPVPKT